MRDRNINKLPGCSWIEVNNDVHFFVTCDQAHPEINFINVMLRSLVPVLYEHGYMLAFEPGKASVKFNLSREYQEADKRKLEEDNGVTESARVYEGMINR
ncbi:Pentatricopeptide repeat-containing protein [Drosera capensis]